MFAGKVTATLKATDVNGVTYCTTYQGETTFEDQSVNWLREDVNIQGGTLIICVERQNFLVAERFVGKVDVVVVAIVGHGVGVIRCVHQYVFGHYIVLRVTLRLQAPEPAVGQPMLAPAGTYRLGTGTVEDFHIAYECEKIARCNHPSVLVISLVGNHDVHVKTQATSRSAL